jgi:hypothetical protein
MHPRMRLLLVASLVALIATTGQASASADAPADEQGPQRGGGGAPGATGGGGRGGPAGPPLRDPTWSRPVSAYPLVAKYKGRGSTDEAASFESSTGF